MKRITRMGTIALAIVASTASLSAIPAGADPSVSGSMNGVPLTEPSIVLPGTIQLHGDGCPAVEGQPTYMGQYVSLEGDPWSVGGTKVYETQTDGEGTFDFEFTLESPPASFTTYARWFCATQSPENLDDSAMLWVGSLNTMTITAGESQALRTTQVSGTAAKSKAGIKTISSTKRTSKAAAAPTSNKLPAAGKAPTLTMSQDPEALPAVDQIDIVGPKAAALKASVDARFKNQRKVIDLLIRVVGANSKAGQALQAQLDTLYIETSFDVLTGDVPNAKTVKRYVAELEESQSKVGVIEDIALTEHKASWWNKR